MTSSVPEAPWQRLDARMLLVHPVTELVRFLPVLLGLLIAGGASGAGPWALLGIGVPVSLGIVRYLTTTYRVTTARVELRRGLLQRHNLSTPLDRVRTVDLTASPIHRVLGLATVVIGTGSVATDADERLLLDALPREHATALRRHLLESHAAAGVDPAATTGEEVVARFSPRWLWYAPFSGTVLVAAGVAVGALAQLAELAESVEIRITEDDVAALEGVVVVPAVAVGALVLATVLSVAGYLVANGGFTLARAGAAWHVRRGLLTRRETSIDVARLAGVSIGEPAALRLARGRRLGAIVTGLGSDGAGSAVLLPPAPARTVAGAAAAVLGAPGPVTGPLLRHGRAARNRRFTRALLGTIPVVAACGIALALGASGWAAAPAAVAIAAALGLAADRSRSLGHGHIDGHVVTRSGSLLRRREALAAPHVIGWNLRATWFQRRAGLVSVAATTAGGRGRVAVDDVPESAALALALAATPGLLDEFLEEAT